ncbi:hypothetical protein VUR80DRAFT_1782 [Thermomyces stellatus]
MSSPPVKRKRVRTESQMNQKRLADRTKQRENRHENKRRLEKIENDISDIKSALQSLTLPLQAPNPGLAPQGLPHSNRQELALGASPRSSCGGFGASLSPTPPLLSVPHISPGHAFEQHVSSSYAPTHHTAMSWRRIESKLLNCQCGFPHYDQFDCIDQCTITAFYHHQVAYPTLRSPAGFLPRNPPLPAMMLHDTEENVATFLITGFLRQYRNKGIEQLLGFYLLAYRYMRVSRVLPRASRVGLTFVEASWGFRVADFIRSIQWQMNPCDETIRDVPSWLLPTEVQKLNAHSVVVDYLPWPRLRDYLCISGDEDLQRSLNLYLDSMQLNWPSGRPLFTQSEGGEMSISPEFEVAVCKLENWHMGAPWSETFPHLMDLVGSL